jgi:DNA polymerase-3 subunit chi
MTEIWFYHLTSQPLERALPVLLEKSLERGWKVVVQGTGEERLASLDTLLWTYSESSFLAHGMARDGDGELQPVYLTTGAENPNGAAVRFCIEGADIAGVLEDPPKAYDRIILMFDGNDDEQLANARAQWKALKAQNRQLSYYQQDEEGRWSKKA